MSVCVCVLSICRRFFIRSRVYGSLVIPNLFWILILFKRCFIKYLSLDICLHTDSLTTRYWSNHSLHNICNCAITFSIVHCSLFHLSCVTNLYLIVMLPLHQCIKNNTRESTLPSITPLQQTPRRSTFAEIGPNF